MEIPRLVIGATQSGTGKTSLSLALVHALTRRGLRVQAFKVGPDFLDPTHLAIASGRPCYNLDGWMSGEAYVKQLFARASATADIAVIEGVMGLFDGADPRTSEGSTAEIARWLGAPVLLLTNAHGAARSLAATVKGFCELEAGLTIAGVVANHIGSDRHIAWLREALQSANLPPLLGGILRGAFPVLPSRHLGLVTGDERTLTPAVLNELADALEKSLPLEEVIALARGAKSLADAAQRSPETLDRRVRLGIARDEAFHFYYPDNLEALRAAGCELVFFSPLHDEQLPKDLDAMYLGGGYPEEYAAALAANRDMRAAVRAFASAGHAVYAECGGLMYLAKTLETREGQNFPMAGVMSAQTRMLPRRKALGYVEVTLAADSLWGRSGAVVRGHEFHYSELVGEPTGKPEWRKVYTLQHRRSEKAVAEGYQRGRILASYVHTHFASRPDAVRAFVANCGGAR
jgi:cobyrinic acid a,c-diamide synthase